MGLPPGDPENGKNLFKSMCGACHMAQKDGRNKNGPNLYGIVGKKCGQIDGYVYSDACKNSNITWTKDNLSQYLENPKTFMPGTKMIFAGVKKDQERSDIIEFLVQVSK